MNDRVVGHPLDPLFRPRSIVVVGGSDQLGSVGQIVLSNLRVGGFAGELFVVNHAHAVVQGIESLRSVRELPEAPDLALIAVPAAAVPGVLEDCGVRGVRAAIVLSYGFAERGGEGSQLQRELERIARRYRVRLLGPNCIGFVRPNANTHALLARGFARPGRLALVSQSGAVCTAILDWAEEHGIGFSLAASIGNAADVGFGDVLDYLTLDIETSAILVYTEGVDQARRFMSGLRAAARIKPVVVLKAGRAPETIRAAATHTAALAGSDAVFESALRRAGAVRATNLEQLFAAAELLSGRRRVSGNRVAIVSNAYGLGVLAADFAAAQGLALASLSPDTISALDAVLPGHWSRTNPVSLHGDASAARYAAALEPILDDPHVDGAIALITPLAMTEPMAVARVLDTLNNETRKPVLAAFLGGSQVQEAREWLHERGVPELPGADAAVNAFGYLARFAHSQRMLLEVPTSLSDRAPPDLARARALIDAALAHGQRSLPLREAKALLACFRVPVSETLFAASAEAACEAASRLGLPVALKIDSPDIAHKTSVDGVRLGLTSLEAVRVAFDDVLRCAREHAPGARIAGVSVERMHGKRYGRELLAGIASDPAFGPVIAFGAGGNLVELIADRSLALPPLSAAMARDMIARTRVQALLGIAHGMPAAALWAIEDVLLSLSELACECPEVQELDINPLIADADGVIAVDVHLQLRAAESARLPGQPEGRYAHCAIEPYPSQLARTITVRDGRSLLVRLERPEDAQLEQEFVRKLSGESRYYRFHHGLAELSAPMLVRFTQIDYDREMAFVALTGEGATLEQVGNVRYVQEFDEETCEFALVVADAWNGVGLGTALMQIAIAHARSKGLVWMRGDVLFENKRMLRLCERLGFRPRPHEDDATLRTVWLKLNDPRPSRVPPRTQPL
jgi:acetyltransferase